MIRVKLSTNFPDWPLIRQTPGRIGIWNDCRFFINEDIDECDFWVVYDDVVQAETTRCPPGNTLLITGEPPSVKTYHGRFLAQFGTVLTSHRDLVHPNIIHSQQALPWMVGCRYVRETGQWDKTHTKDYDELSALPIIPKTKLLSVISSNKTISPGHMRRLAFVEALKQRFGGEIDVFGRGLRDVEDKWDAIAPYQYHVAIENGQFPDYWTEKLSDTLLAGAYPLYAGCPNIRAYFGEDVLTQLDLNDFDASLAAMTAAIEGHWYEATTQARQNARTRLLNEYNLFPLLAGFVSARQSAGAKRMVQVQPHSRFSRTLLSRFKDRARKLRGKTSN